MQALPESRRKAGIASEAIIKLQSSITPLSNHVWQECRCGSSSAEQLETNTSDNASERGQGCAADILADVRVPSATHCCYGLPRLWSQHNTGAGGEVDFIYLSYCLILCFFPQTDSVSLSGNERYGLQASRKGGWATQFSTGYASKQFAEMCKATHTCNYDSYTEVWVPCGSLHFLGLLDQMGR